MTQTQDVESMVRLVAIDSRFHVAPVFITPKYDDVTREFLIGDKRYKGIPVGTEKDSVIVADGTPLRVSDVDSYRIAHLQTFNVNNEVEKFLLEMAKDSGFVALSKEQVNPSVHRYYVEDKEKEAVVSISKSEKTFGAMSKIKSMSMDEMLDFSRLVGIYSTNMSKTMVEAALMKLAQDKPDFILSTYDDKNRKVRTFLKKLVDAHIIRIQNGKFVYGNDLVGVNEEYAVEYLKDNNNNALVSQWNAMLTKKGEKVTEVTE